MHEELRRTQGAAALACGTGSPTLPVRDDPDLRSRLVAVDDDEAATVGLNAASMTVPVSSPKCRALPVRASQMTAPPSALAPATRPPSGLQGEHPAARPQGQFAGWASRRRPRPAPRSFPCRCSRSRAARRGRRGRRASSGRTPCSRRAASPGSIGALGRDGHSRPLPSSETVATCLPVRAESRSADAVACARAAARPAAGASPARPARTRRRRRSRRTSPLRANCAELTVAAAVQAGRLPSDVRPPRPRRHDAVARRPGGRGGRCG